MFVTIMSLMINAKIELSLISNRLHAIAGDLRNSLVLRLAAQAGAVSIDMIVMIFVGMVILFQLIPQISNSNNTVQASANVSTMGKWASALGEWLFPLFGVLGLVFLLMRVGGKWGGRGGRKN